MAIPISSYIDITTKVVASVGERDWSGLVFTTDNMKAGASIKANYDAGKVVAITQSDIANMFDSTTSIYNFAMRYFGNGGTVINVAKIVDSENAEDAYARVIQDFQNFGSFTVLGYNASDLTSIAASNVDSGYEFIVPVDSTTDNSVIQTFDNINGCHIVLGEKETIRDEVTANLAAAMVMGWYADVNYNQTGAASSIDYKTFAGFNPTVDTLADKIKYDGLKVNYIGRVQAHGFQRSFYQTGRNMDGEDIGVFRDSMWIKGYIEAAWIDLVSSVGKVPANMTGAAMVRNIVVGAAVRGIENGVILNDKPLSDSQIAVIRNYTNDENAVAEVITTGYYVDTKIVKVGDKYTCQYTLVYAKGDHIAKVDGVHVLV